MLPVSGALQLKTSGDHSTRPMISAWGAYSRLVSPPWTAGSHRFQSCAARAFAFSSSIRGTVEKRFGNAFSSSW
jgi:hypothetical protein